MGNYRSHNSAPSNTMTAWFPRLRLVAPVSVIRFAGICCRCGQRYAHLTVRVVHLRSRESQEGLCYEALHTQKTFFQAQPSMQWAKPANVLLAKVAGVSKASLSAL